MKIKYKTIKNNSKLTDFEDIKETIIEHKTKLKHAKQPTFEIKQSFDSSLNRFIR